MRWVVLLLGIVLALIGGLLLAQDVQREWEAGAEERAVAALPGVGYGWLDTLRRVAGPAQVDTVTDMMLRDYQGSLLGVFERWHASVSVNVRMIDYARFVRGGGGTHPLTMAIPPGVTAHEFGHVLQHAVYRSGERPRWASDEAERFADRFARAMLALRGWDDPDPADAVLNHRVRYLLLRSYWPRENL